MRQHQYAVSQAEQLRSKGRGTGQMFVRLSFPSVLNSHVKGADGADLRLLLVLEMRGGGKKKRLLSLATQLKETSCRDGKCHQVLAAFPEP